MQERVRKTSETSDRDAEQSEKSTALAKRGEDIKTAIDDLLDEIDEALEETAEEFVQNYVQRGGE